MSNLFESGRRENGEVHRIRQHNGLALQFRALPHDFACNRARDRLDHVSVRVKPHLVLGKARTWTMMRAARRMPNRSTTGSQKEFVMTTSLVLIVRRTCKPYSKSLSKLIHSLPVAENPGNARMVRLPLYVTQLRPFPPLPIRTTSCRPRKTHATARARLSRPRRSR